MGFCCCSGSCCSINCCEDQDGPSIPRLTKIEEKNLSMEEQLILAIKRSSLRSIVNCYIRGVNANSVIDPTNGENPLHLAVRTNIATVQAVLLLFSNEQMLTGRNNNGDQPLQLAGSYSSRIRKCIQLFIAIHCKKTNPDDEGQNEEEERLQNNDERNKPILLSLDGGGIKGLVLIRVLMIIERNLGRDLWPLIDWVAGKSLTDCQKLYLQLKNIVFRGSRPYNPAVLERILIQTYSTDFMSSIEKPKLLLTSAKMNIAPPTLVLFRNYQLPDELTKEEDRLDEMGYVDRNVTIWKAARCSSAAPTYFPPFDDIYVDGGVICNNPTMELLTEFVKLRPYFQLPNPHCVISIGTGTPPSKSLTIHRSLIWRLLQRVSRNTEFMRNMAQGLVEQITESNRRPVMHCKAFCAALGVPFFRFSPRLHDDVRINETDDACILKMLWDVEVAMYASRNEVDQLVKILQSRT
uniref:phospholipase A2 n=1 Tax=Meloidogyne hapla TaxID=6305 RepID=A0A1I8BS31_MELHA